LRDPGSTTPILRPMHYVQNFDPSRIAEEGVFRLPYSVTTRLSFVDLSDVAEVAARVLIEDGHAYATYPLCGTDLLSGQEVADIVSRAAGVPVDAKEIPLAAFVDMISRHQPLLRDVTPSTASTACSRITACTESRATRMCCAGYSTASRKRSRSTSSAASDLLEPKPTHAPRLPPRQRGSRERSLRPADRGR